MFFHGFFSQSFIVISLNLPPDFGWSVVYHSINNEVYEGSCIKSIFNHNFNEHSIERKRIWLPQVFLPFHQVLGNIRTEGRWACASNETNSMLSYIFRQLLYLCMSTCH